jgi:polyhydroxyalkanoate synthesis regulator phasin
MNPETVLQSLQKGFHTTLGAAAFVVELVQNPDQRDEKINRVKNQWDLVSEEWAAQGEMTEQEARSFVERMFNQQTASQNSGYTPTGPVAPPDVQEDLKDLTEQIAALRAELEKLRQSDS